MSYFGYVHICTGGGLFRWRYVTPRRIRMGGQVGHRLGHGELGHFLCSTYYCSLRWHCHCWRCKWWCCCWWWCWWSSHWRPHQWTTLISYVNIMKMMFLLISYFNFKMIRLLRLTAMRIRYDSYCIYLYFVTCIQVISCDVLCCVCIVLPCACN